jgi:hypothetical protein
LAEHVQGAALEGDAGLADGGALLGHRVGALAARGFFVGVGGALGALL